MQSGPSSVASSPSSSFTASFASQFNASSFSVSVTFDIVIWSRRSILISCSPAGISLLAKNPHPIGPCSIFICSLTKDFYLFIYFRARLRSMSTTRNDAIFVGNFVDDSFLPPMIGVLSHAFYAKRAL